ncbi:MAG: twin transmembrane helix small protein [Pseudomonadota bacterium]
MNLSMIIITLACAVVGLILLRGLWNMMQGGSASKSQQLMRMRVAAQAVAVVVIVIVVLIYRQ